MELLMGLILGGNLEEDKKFHVIFGVLGTFFFFFQGFKTEEGVVLSC